MSAANQIAGQVARSSRADVRNPMLKLPEVQEAFASLTPEARAALVEMLRAVSVACRASAEVALRRHKPPMYSYWKAQAVNARHLALAGRASIASATRSDA